MGRYVLSALVAVLLLAMLVPTAGAMGQWCEEDPLVVIQTPGGSQVPLYVTNGALGEEHLPAVLLAAIDYTTQSTDGGQATVVKLWVTIPDDVFDGHFETRSTVSDGPAKTGTIYAQAQGFSGQTMWMEFKLQVP